MGYGEDRYVWARRGLAGMARHGTFWRGVVRLVQSWLVPVEQGRQGEAMLGMVRSGKVRQARFVGVSRGEFRCGMARQARHG